MKSCFLDRNVLAAALVAMAGLANVAAAQDVFPFTDGVDDGSGPGGGEGWEDFAIINPIYVVEEMPTLGGLESFATAISDNGWIAGGAKNAAGITRAVRLQRGGVAQDVGSLPGLAHSTAYSINSAGDVVGVSATTANMFSSSAQPWIKRGNAIIDLDANNRGVYSAATAISETGLVVGTSSFTGAGSVESFKWSTGNPVNLPELPGDQCRISYGMGVNAAGSVVGYSAAPGACGDNRAVLYPSTGGVIDLGTLGGPNAQAQAINALGDVVGFSELSTGQNRATLWSGGAIHNLGTLAGASFALGINSDGIVVGYFLDSRNQQRACVWISGQMFDLNTLMGSGGAGWRLLIATGINEQGQIVGQGRNAAGRLRGFVLTPPCRSDFNRDGGIDAGDIGVFFDAWQAGMPDTDLNIDGGVDATDVYYFFDLWTNGRC